MKLNARKLIDAMLAREDRTIPTTAGIYAIVNSVNGRAYIGSSVNMRDRINGHRWGLRNGKHSNQLLRDEWAEYGEAAFVLGWLHKCRKTSRDHLWNIEQELTRQILGAGCYCWTIYGQRSKYAGHPAIPGSAVDVRAEGRKWLEEKAANGDVSAIKYLEKSDRLGEAGMLREYLEKAERRLQRAKEKALASQANVTPS